MGEKRMHIKFFRWGALKEGEYVQDLGIDGWIILRFSKTWDLRMSTGFIWPRIGFSGGLF
jgi:hypothetical protein